MPVDVAEDRPREGGDRSDDGLPTPPEVVLGAIDGVRAIHPAEPADGDVMASLSFRVGTADEPVVLRGITHLVEHLTLTAFESERVAWNGHVDLTRTVFWANGPVEEVRRFITHVTRGLASLPVERVDHERRVLQVESRSREASIFDAVLTTRYGLEGPGRGVLPEWGLEWVGPDDLDRWVSEWYTRDNAALWSTAPLDGLELPLREGSARPPTLPGASMDLPVVEGRRLGLVLCSSVVERSTGTTTAVRVLERRLRKRLRGEAGITYAAQASYVPLTADRALVTASADVHDDHCEDATTGFVGVLEDLAERGATDDELAEDRRLLADAVRQESSVNGWLDRVASGLLFGETDPLDTSFVAELEGLRSEDVAAGARAIRDAAVLIVPECSESIVGPPFQVRHDRVVDPVQGRAARSRVAPLVRNPRVVFGRDGATHWDSGGEATTVRFADCVGVVGWQDGTRLLYAADGSMLYLDAEDWRGFDRIRETIDRHAPGPVARVERDPDRHEAQSREARRWGLWLMAGRLLPGAIGVLLVLIAVAAVATGGVDGLADQWRRGAVIAAASYLVGLWFYRRSEAQRNEPT